MRHVSRLPLSPALLAVLFLSALIGCGSGSTNVPLDALEGGAVDLVGKSLRVELSDGQSMRFDASRVEYPYMWGQRFTGERMPRRDMRIDLRDVVKLKVLDVS